MIARMSAIGMAAVALSAPSVAQAETLAFVACPIVQDTSTVPCWLAEYKGETYYFGIQSDVSAPFNPPSLGHMALIEGTANADQRICGGIVLEPVKVSIMPELSPECDELRLAVPGLELPFEPPRPPGPSGGQLAYSYPSPPPPPQPPFKQQAFDIYFPLYGSVDFKTPGALNVALNYARAVKARKLTVTGQRAAVRLTDGTVLEEREGIAERRARQVARMFEGLVESVDSVGVEFSEKPKMGDWHERKVTITVYP